MKEKILAQLKLKYAGVQNNLLGLVADKLSTTVTEESAIESAVADLEKLPISISDFAKMLQTEGDRRATEASTTRETTLREKFNLVEKTPNNPPAKDPPADDPTAKAIADMKKQLDELKAKETLQQMRNKAITALKTNNVPEKFFDQIITDKAFNTEEEVTGVVDTITNSYREFEQEMVDKGFGSHPKPMGSPTKEGVSASVAQYIAQKSPEATNDLGGKKL